jgi:tetratricopeptide (TPR) repeat protein
VQLAQSPFLSLISDDRIQHTLRLMGRPESVPLTPNLAQEVCERTAGTAVLEGSIDSLGSAYVLSFRAKYCRTAKMLDQQQVQVQRKEDVLNALSEIAGKFRTRAGESLATIQEHATPLAEATTPSIDALKAYTSALQLWSSIGPAAAGPLFQRAIEIDPQFAMAHAWLARVYADVGEYGKAIASSGKAYELRNRTSDPEKFWISAFYNSQVLGNLEKTEQICQVWAQTYPRDREPFGFLSGLIHGELGKYEQALEEAKTALALDPQFAPGHSNLVWNNLMLNRVPEAEKALQAAIENKFEFPDIFVLRYAIAFLKQDQPGMDNAVALTRGKTGIEDWVLAQAAAAAAYSGRLQQARTLSNRAVELARQAGQKDKAALYQAGAAVREALFGNVPEARRHAAAALEASNGREVQYGAAFALAFSGDSARPQALASDLEKRFPEDTVVRFTYLPVIRSLLQLRPPHTPGEPQKAIDFLQTAMPYELGVPGTWLGFFGFIYPDYVRGEAWLAAHQGQQAAAEFRKILDHPGLVLVDIVGALAHLESARAYALAGDAAAAKRAYQDFLTLWKDADPDLPLLKRARAEFAGLQ